MRACLCVYVCVWCCGEAKLSIHVVGTKTRLFKFCEGVGLSETSLGEQASLLLPSSLNTNSPHKRLAAQGPRKVFLRPLAGFFCVSLLRNVDAGQVLQTAEGTHLLGCFLPTEPAGEQS